MTQSEAEGLTATIHAATGLQAWAAHLRRGGDGWAVYVDLGDDRLVVVRRPAGEAVFTIGTNRAADWQPPGGYDELCRLLATAAAEGATDA